MPTPAAIADHYSKMQIQTASLPKAICMLHERCLHLLALAQEEEKDRRRVIDKAQNILSQLQAALIISDGTSQSIWYLYDYCYMLLERAEQQDLSQSAQIVGVLSQTFHDLMKRR